MSRIDRRDVIEAITTGGVAFAWYALPDAVRSPRARGAIKVGLMVPTTLIGVTQTKRAAEESPDDVASALAGVRALVSGEPVLDADAVLAPDADAPAHADTPHPSTRTQLIRQGAVLAASVFAVGAAVVGIIATERGIYRLGEHLAARGTRWPHTRIGLVAGLASAGLSIATAPLTPPR